MSLDDPVSLQEKVVAKATCGQEAESRSSAEEDYLNPCTAPRLSSWSRCTFPSAKSNNGVGQRKEKESSIHCQGCSKDPSPWQLNKLHPTDEDDMVLFRAYREGLHCFVNIYCMLWLSGYLLQGIIGFLLLNTWTILLSLHSFSLTNCKKLKSPLIPTYFHSLEPSKKATQLFAHFLET